MSENPATLKKAIRPVHLWAISVGLVISGEYFGWNYGWGVAGTLGFLLATLVVTLLYVTFIFSFTELTTAIPNAGGPFSYARKALGPVGGLIAGYATLVEFLLATPAIAFALGNYLHFLHPGLPVLGTAIGVYLLLTGVNLLGIKESAAFTLLFTLLAVVELLVYFGIVAPHFKMENFLKDALPFGYSGVFAALPFAVWLYVCIEGVAMVAEEVKNPARNIPIGYISGILTLVVLAIAVMLFTGGITNWQRLSAIDYPLPEAIGIVLGKDSGMTKIFAGIGLFGLIASFNGIIISYSRQIFALAREGYLPSLLAAIGRKRQTPYNALIVGALAGIVALCISRTDREHDQPLRAPQKRTAAGEAVQNALLSLVPGHRAGPVRDHAGRHYLLQPAAERYLLRGLIGHMDYVSYHPETKDQAAFLRKNIYVLAPYHTPTQLSFQRPENIAGQGIAAPLGRCAGRACGRNLRGTRSCADDAGRPAAENIPSAACYSI